VGDAGRGAGDKDAAGVNGMQFAQDEVQW